MDDRFDDFDDFDNSRSLPAPLKAALIGSVGILIIHGISYLTAGLGIVVSAILFTLLYLTVGILGASFSSGQNSSDGAFQTGALSGFLLWIISIIINFLFALIFGISSFGLGFLIGVPYFCLCGSVELGLGAFFAAIGGFIYGLFWGGKKDDEFDLYDY